MKKLSCILVLFFLTIMAKAQNANAIVFTENGEKFTVILNGLRQNDKPETNVKIKNLNAPQYKMKIIFEDVRLGETSFNLFLEAGMERTFSLSKNTKGKYVMRFISAVPVADEPAVIAPQQVQQQDQNNNNTVAPAADNFNINMNVDGNTMNMNMSGTGVNMNVNTSGSATTTTTYGNPPPPVVYLPGYSGPVGCERPIDPIDFNELKASIASKSFEETKLTIAKQVLRDHCLLTSQVKELVKLFTFEETKLDFAKYAYSYTYDRANYYKINDVFTFESSIEELNAYINSQR